MANLPPLVFDAGVSNLPRQATSGDVITVPGGAVFKSYAQLGTYLYVPSLTYLLFSPTGYITEHRAPTIGTWTASASITAGAFVSPTTYNGFVYYAMNSGTTGTTQPTWPTTPNAQNPPTVVDGGVTWQMANYYIGQNTSLASGPVMMGSYGGMLAYGSLSSPTSMGWNLWWDNAGNVTINNNLYLPAKSSNTFFAGPTSGSAAVPIWRSITQNDIGAVLPSGYIDGLVLSWNSASSITVSTGNCYLPNGTFLPISTAITLSGLSLSASTMYHVYVYNNAGTPAAECVTTAPASPYNGTARAKTGDTSRRYVGSVLTDSSGNIYNFKHNALVNYVAYQANVSGTPFQVVAGTASTATSVACGGVVPGTSSLASMIAANNDASYTVYLGNASFAPTSSAFMSYVATKTVYALNVQLDSTTSFQYLFNGTPTANFVGRVTGYYFQR